MVEECWAYEELRYFDYCMRLWDFPKPTIAQVQGACIAGGFMLANMCDLVVAADDALFGDPVTHTMGAVATEVLIHPWVMGLRQAKEMLYTGEYIDAARALQVGLLNHVVEVGQVFEQAMALARQIAANAPISVRRVKAMALRGLDMPVATALRQDPGLSPYYSEDRKEGVRARQEKRPPVWKNR